MLRNRIWKDINLQDDSELGNITRHGIDQGAIVNCTSTTRPMTMIHYPSRLHRDNNDNDYV